MRKNWYRTLAALLLAATAASGAQASLANASESAGAMSKSEYAYMYRKSGDLQERWSAMEARVKKKLPEAELFLSARMFDALFDLDIRSDWKDLESMLKACKTADDFIALLHTDFSGINQGAAGEPQRQDLARAMESALQAAGFGDLPYRAYTRPTAYCYPYYGSPDWYVHAGSEDGAKKKQWPHVTVGVTKEGKVLQLDSVGYLPEKVKIEGALTDAEWQFAVASALDFIGEHALISAEGAREIEGFHVSFAGMADDPYVELYVYHGVWIDEEKRDAPAMKLGYNLRVGIRTGRIYTLMPLVEEIVTGNS